MSDEKVQWYVRLTNGTKLGRANSRALAWHETAKWTATFVVGAVLVRVTRRKSEARKALRAAAEAWAMTTNAEADGKAWLELEKAANAFRDAVRKVKP